MNPLELELALKKQRLQIASEGLRRDFALHATGLQPLFRGADIAVDGAHWMRRNPQIVIAGLVALLVARPKRAWRWARRAFLGWQTWRKLRELIEPRRPA